MANVFPISLGLALAALPLLNKDLPTNNTKMRKYKFMAPSNLTSGPGGNVSMRPLEKLHTDCPFSVKIILARCSFISQLCDEFKLGSYFVLRSIKERRVGVKLG